MLKYECLTGGDLQTNSYLVWNKNKQCAIIDPYDGEISERIGQLGLKPIMVLATHGHFDHVLGVLDLKLIYGIPFGCSNKDKFLLNRTRETARFFLKREVSIPNIEKIEVDLEVVDNLDLGEEKLMVIKTPGHTPGGVCFYHQKEGLVFSGDTIFAEAIGATNTKYGSKKELEESIKKILELPEETIILAGHGREGSVGEEKRFRTED